MKKIILLVLQLAIYSCLWYGNIAIASYALPTLRSMDALCTAARTNPGLFLDFAKNYVCAQLASEKPTMIWDQSAQTATLNADLQARADDPAVAERQRNCAPYTPQSLLLLMPLTHLPLNKAIIVFEIFSLIFFVLAITILIKHYQSYSWQQITLWWFIALSAFPIMQNLCLGQMSGIIAGLLAIFFLTWNDRRVIVPAICFALTIAIKPHRGLIMLTMCLAAKKYRLLAATFFVSIIFLIACVSVMGAHTIINYPGKVLNIEADRYQSHTHTEHFLFATSTFLSASELITAFVPQSAIGWLLSGTTIVDLSIIYFVWRKAINIGPKTFPIALAISILIDLILGPYEPIYDILLINVAWALTVNEIRLSQFALLKDWRSQFWFLAFSFFPVFSWLAGCCFPSINGALLMIYSIAIIAMAFFLLLSPHHHNHKSSNAT